jgi:hypothetical protein
VTLDTADRLLVERMQIDQEFLDNAAANQVLLNDAFEHRRVARPVPRPFRIDDCDRPAFADTKTVRFRPQDASLILELQLLEASLQEVPGGKTAFLLATLRGRLVAAEKKVATSLANADRAGGLAEAVPRLR